MKKKPEKHIDFIWRKRARPIVRCGEDFDKNLTKEEKKTITNLLKNRTEKQK